MMDADVAEMAKEAGVPYPFYEVHLTGIATNGRYGEIRVQFESREDAATYQGGYPEPEDSPVRQALEAALGAPLITAGGGLMRCYDPREWQGNAQT